MRILPPYPFTIPAARDRPVLVWDQGSLDYAGLLRLVRALAEQLDQAGVKPGSAVPILAGLAPGVLAAVLACLSRGAAAVPLDPRLGPAPLEKLLRPLRAECCLAGGPREESLLASLGAGCRILCLDRMPSGAIPGEGLSPRFHLSPALPALLVHSSGSTGRPKRILYRRRELARFLKFQDLLFRQFPDAPEGGYESPLVATVPPQHLGGLGFCLQALAMGRTLHLLPAFSARRYWRLAGEHEVRLILLAPSLLREILALPAHEREGARPRYCLAAGEALDAALAREAERGLGAKVFSAYGLSECLSGLGHPRHSVLEGRLPAGSCGRLLFGQVRLVDAGGRDNPREGELWVKNPTVFPCYLDEKLNRRRLREGWFRTGDLFRRSPEGDYFYRGRRDAMFTVNGRNVYPAELEALAEGHPDVRRAVAVPLRARGRAFPGLLVQAQGRRPCRAEDLIDWCLSRGGGAAVPGWIAFRKDLPSLPAGKLDRRECRRWLQRHYRLHAPRGAGA